MGVFDKLLSAVRLNDDFDDDFLDDDDYLDDVDDDFLDDDDSYTPRASVFSRFSRKNREEADDLDEEIEKPKKEKRSKEKPVREKAPKEKTVRESVREEKVSSKPEKAVKAATTSKITPMRSSRKGSQITNMEVCVIQPKSMEDTHEIADTLQENSTVILNLEGIDVELAQRISDFSFGACYALGGRLQKVSSYIFVLVPYNVDITGDLQNVLNASAPSLRAGY